MLKCFRPDIRGMDIKSVLKRLEAMGDRANAEGMARFGINPDKTLGVPMPALRKLGKELGKDHALALALWDSGVHEARILASIVDELEKVDEGQMERWVRDFDSWDVCDQVCMNLFDRTTYCDAKIREWSGREREFEKRAAFALIASSAVHDKRSPDSHFLAYLPIIEKSAGDERNFVRKAVNWALRQIGKRNAALNSAAIASAKRLRSQDSKSARWIASDALRELEGSQVQTMLSKKKGK